MEFESQEHEAELAAALEESRSADQILLDEIAARENERALRRRRISFSLSISLGIGLVIVLWGALGGFYCSSEKQNISQLTLPEIESLLASFPKRTPLSGEQLRRLAEAQRRRYELTGLGSDLGDYQRSVLRAQNLSNKVLKEDSMRNPTTFALILVVLVIAALGGGAVLVYNSLAGKDETVDGRWGQVQTALQRRLDLIPGLVEAVKGYAQHEQETLRQVTEARGRAASALTAVGSAAPRTAVAAESLDKSTQDLGLALSKLMAVVEGYPDLKANASFIAFQDQLEGTENRIAVERQRYNDAVRVYNSALRRFPGNLVGAFFGFSPRSYFESQDGAEQAPSIKLTK